MKILLVEDDKLTAVVLSELLTAQYYTVELATDGQVGLELATSWDYDLILLNLLIPKLDGIYLCRQLRAQGYQKPILLLAAKDSSTDAIKGLDAGADDYVIKPYDLPQLLARIRALLRRGEAPLTPAVLSWGDLCVNPISAEVTYRGQTLSLSPKEYSLLGLFLRNPQRIFSRSDIIDRLWSIDTSPSERAVTNLIKDLRQKLKVAGMTIDLLETVYGLGYRSKAPQKEAGVSGKREGRPQKELSFQKVLERYRHTFAERVSVLEQVEQALWAGDLDQSLQQSAAQEAHKLAGSLGSFGYAAGSNLARTLEHLLMRDKSLAQIDAFQVSKLVAELKQLLQPPASLVAQTLKPAAVPLVLVIDDELSFTNQLKTDAFTWGLEVEVVPNLVLARQRIVQCSPHAVLLNLSLQDTVENRLALLRELQERSPLVPILAITAEQDSLAERVLVSRLGVQKFLHKPIATAEVLEIVTQLLPQFPSAEARVMLVDDDMLALATLSDLLQPWGLQVTILQDPSQFWNVFTTTNPDLLVMDLEMPHFNGIDLCRVVRQDPQWGNLPILVVTAHTDMASIQQVFAAGADDFIGKPVVGPELVTRVINRIDRSRLRQELETMKRRIGK